MKNIKTLVLSSFFFSGVAISGYSQTKSEEKIILQDNKNSSEIVIEIRDGEVIIDGKKVAPYNLNRNLKIIKKLGRKLEDIAEKSDDFLNNDDVTIQYKKFNDEAGATDANSSQKAMLGVNTEPSQRNDGAVINSVNANTPAAKAELKEGDVITKIDNITITNPQDLVTAISNYKPGDKVMMIVRRDGKEMNKSVTLESRRGDDMGSMFGGPDIFGGGDMMQSLQEMMKNFGMDGDSNPFENMEELGGGKNFKIYGNGEIAKSNGPKLGVQIEERADGQGLRVTKVEKGSPTDKAGIREEDIIRSIGGNPTNSIADFADAVKEVQEKKDIVVKVMRAGKEQSLFMQIEKPLRKKDF
jgi:serine protease Do